MSNTAGAQTEQPTSPYLGEFQSWFSVLNAESPRGAVLTAASILDSLLEGLLRAFLAPNPGSKKLLEGFNAPFGTFSSKIAAAHALGLITSVEFHDLELIRKIRNEFAHEIHVSFESSSVLGLCAKLQSAPEWDSSPPKELMSGQMLFISAAAVLILTTRVRRDSVVQLVTHP
ncbi:hypothetical protein I5U90_05720 [Stenotrophomonas maltophilia]|nr:hypothetical protein [Stenotrophomonas maltophilia]